MELHVIKREGRETVVLLDNEMRIVKPVYDYLKFQRQKDKALNTLRMIMGHEHLSTTQKYTHLSNPYIEDSLSRYWNQSTLIGGGSDGK